MRVLWLTNDLPPRAGGIQQFVDNLLRRVHPASTVVVGPAQDGAAAHDAAAPYRVVRHRAGIWPTPAVLRLTRRVAATHRPNVVVLGASWPLGHLAPALGRDPGVPVVALTHGLEAGIAGAGLGLLIRRASRGLAAATTISDWTEQRLAPHLRAGRVVRVPPGVDVSVFRPDLDGRRLRERWGIPADAPVVGCVSRLVERKGQDRLLDAWPAVHRRHPDAWLVLVGTGPLADDLAARAERLGPDAHVVLTGEVPWEDLPASHAALDVFAMPCRTRWGGLNVEGLGIVYLEAQACGVPAVAGDSGGAPEAVRDGETGLVVDGRDVPAIVGALDRLLADPDLRQRMGRAGRTWVEQRWSWDAIADRFAALLDEVADS